MILESILDGTGITKIEFRSAFYLLREFAFTDDARQLFIEGLSPGVEMGLPRPDPAKTSNSDAGPYYEIVDGIQYDRAALQVSS